MPTIFGGGTNFSPIAAILGAPIDTHSARNAARQERLMLLQGIQQLDSQRLAQMEARDSALQSDLSSLASLDVLTPGKTRIQEQIAKPIRQEIKNRIKDQYQGKYEDWLAAEGKFYNQKIREAVQSNPIIQQELQNKINYGLIRKDQMDGKITRKSDIQSWLAYNAGQDVPITYSGGLEAPSDIVEYFQKTEAPGAPYGRLDFKTGAQNPIPVMRKDVMSYLTSKYGNKEDAQYVMDNHLGYKDGDWNYKLHTLSPTWLQEAKLKQANYNLGVARMNQQASQFERSFSQRERELQRKIAKDALDAGNGSAKDLKSMPLYLNVYGTDGVPLTRGSRFKKQALVSAEDKRVVEDLLGVTPVSYNNGDGESYKKYTIVPRVNAEVVDAKAYGKDGASYVTTHKGKNSTFLAPLKNPDGSITFDNVDFGTIIKIPQSGGGYKPAVPFTKIKADGTKVEGYWVLPSDESTKLQLLRHPYANKGKRLPIDNQYDYPGQDTQTTLPVPSVYPEDDSN